MWICTIAIVVVLFARPGSTATDRDLQLHEKGHFTSPSRRGGPGRRGRLHDTPRRLGRCGRLGDASVKTTGADM